METFDFCTLTPITLKQIKQLKDIFPIIKYDLLHHTNIYIVEMNKKELTHLSPEIQFVRKFNRENAPHKRFIFNIDGQYIFYTITTNEIQTSDEIYNDENLEYAYDNK